MLWFLDGLSLHLRMDGYDFLMNYFRKNYKVRQKYIPEKNRILVYEQRFGEGNGNPLQYSCLENSMDWGDWWATPRGGKDSDMTKWLNNKNKQRLSCHGLHCDVLSKENTKSLGDMSRLGLSRWFHRPLWAWVFLSKSRDHVSSNTFANGRSFSFFNLIRHFTTDRIFRTLHT